MRKLLTLLSLFLFAGSALLFGQNWQSASSPPSLVKSYFKNGNDIYLGTTNNYLYSHDNGLTFSPVLNFANAPFLNEANFISNSNERFLDLKIYSFNTATFFVSTHLMGGMFANDKLYVSTDHGNSFFDTGISASQSIKTSFYLGEVIQLDDNAFLITRHGSVSYVGQVAEYLVSTDNGSTWTLVDREQQSIAFFGAFEDKLAYKYGDAFAIKRMSDLTVVHNGNIPEPDLSIYDHYKSFLIGSKMFFVYKHKQANMLYVARSFDNGLNWNFDNIQLGDLEIQDVHFYNEAYSGYVLIGKHKIRRHGIVYTGGGTLDMPLPDIAEKTEILDYYELYQHVAVLLKNHKVLVSTNFGGAWTIKEYGEGLEYKFNLEDENGHLWGLENENIFRKNNSSWDLVITHDQDLEFQENRKLDVAEHFGTLFAIYQNKGIYASFDNGGHWHLSKATPSGEYVNRIFSSEGKVIAYSRFGTVLHYSHDAGQTWITLHSPNNEFIGSVYYNNTALILGCNDKYYYSYNLGNSWNQKPYPTTSWARLRWDPADDFFYVMSPDYSNCSAEVWKLISGGNWTKIMETSNLPQYNGNCYMDFDMLRYTNGMLICVSGGAIHYTEDGLNWTTANTPFEGVLDMKISQDDYIYFKSPMQGVWRVLNDDLKTQVQGDIDLELSFTLSDPDPVAYSNFDATLTITNTGSIAATGVKAHIPLPSELVYQGGNEALPSQGTFLPYGFDIWEIGSLSAGVSATLQVNYYKLTGSAVTIYAQVSAANENDVDSTPGNGTCCTANEDDESAISTGAGVQLPDLTLSNLEPQPFGTVGNSAVCIYDLHNIGSAATPTGYKAGVYLSIDNILDPSDVLVGEDPIGSTAVGTYPRVHFPFYIPNNTAPGTYSLIVKIDKNDEVTESNEDNNTIAASFLIVSGQTSLVVSNVDCPPEFPGPGQNLTYSFTVENFNTTASQPTMLYFYNRIEANAVYDPEQLVLFESFMIPSIPSLSSATFSKVCDPQIDYLHPNGWNANHLFLSFDQDGSTTHTVLPDLYCKKFTTDVELTLATTNTQINENEYFDYNITVANNGNQAAYNLMVEITSAFYPPFPADIQSISTGEILNVLIGVGGVKRIWYIPFLNVGESANAFVEDWAYSTLFDANDQFVWTRSIECGHLNDPVPSNNEDDIVFHKAGGPGGDIDLELGILQLHSDPAQYSNYPISLTISNTGTSMATGVKVDFKKPVGVVYTGGNEFTLSQGTFSPHGDEIWNVGSLAAGASATMEVNYFLLATEAPIAYAQVSSANETDVDSSPGNGTPPTPNEDDEASTGTGNPVLLPDLIVTNIQVPAGGLPGETVNITFNLNNLGTSIASGDYTIGVYLSSNSTWDNGDVLVGDVLTGNTPVGTIADVPAVFIISSSIASGNYYMILKADIYDEITESNEQNNENFKLFTVQGNANTIDLELSMSTGNANPSIYSYYSMTLTLNNIGADMATGVKVAFPKHNSVSYYGGNEYNASQGSFTPHGDEVWNVGSLASGGTATLTVNYFVLDSNPFTSYAQVSAANEPDSDSTPGNGSCCTVEEDDEAALSTSPAATAVQSRDFDLEDEFGSHSVSLLRIYPNPAAEQVTMVFNSLAETVADAVIFDAFGNKVLVQKVYFDVGVNEVQFEIEDLPSGVYGVLIETPYRQKPAVFIKARF